MHDQQSLRYQSAPIAEANRLAGLGTQLVDVRERNEFAYGSLPGALNLPLSELATRYNEINADSPVALLCRSGARSAQAADFLIDRGYPDVTNLDGGMLAA